MTVARPRARKQPADVRREELLDAAVRVFARTPYRAAGTAEIAREAGVAEPTIYRHYGSKRELYLAALERCGAKVRDQFIHIAQTEPDPLAALHAMGHWYGDSISLDNEPLRMRQRAIAESEDDEVRRQLRHVYGEILSTINEVIARGQAQGVFNRTAPAEGMAWAFVAIGQAMDGAALMGIPPEECGYRFAQLNIAFIRYLVTDPDHPAIAEHLREMEAARPPATGG